MDGTPFTSESAVPDSAGLNLFRADPALASLARLYLPADLAEHLLPHLDRLGALAGSTLDALAGEADRNPPILHPRNRRGEDQQSIAKHPAYREMERLAFGEFGLAAPIPSRRRPRLVRPPCPPPPNTC